MSAAILVVVHDLSLGGTERIAIRLANAWAERGRRVTLFCGTTAGPLRTLVAPSVRIVAADPAVPRAPGTRRALGRATRAFLRQDPHDIIFVPGNYHWPVVPFVAHSARVVAQVSAALHKPQRARLAQLAFAVRMRRRLRDAAAVATLSDLHARHARTLLPGRRIETIPLPALPDHPPKPVQPPAGRPLVLGVGRLVPEKGFDLLIRAFSALPDRAARLAIVGDGPERARLAALAARMGVTDRVELVGYVADVRAWMERARVFVLPSRHEGYPAVVIEALAAGRAVIATDCTPAVELVVASGGRVVPIDDPAALTDALAAVLAAPAPDPLVVAAGVARFRIGAVAERYLTLFDELTS